MSIENLKNSMGDHAKDIKLNLAAVRIASVMNATATALILTSH